MIPKDILKRVRQIEIRTKRLVDSMFGGEYKSVFKGRGIEFSEVREYVPGDDIRTIDWNVTARTGTPYIKKFVDERELTILFWVDVSASERFGTARQLKSEMAAEVCALLALSAIRNHDKVGLALFTDEIEKYIPPKKGRQHVLRVIREVLYSQPAHRSTDISRAMDHLLRSQKRRAVVFVVSDFLDEGYERALQLASRKHDLIALCIRDPRERRWPRAGYLWLEDAETGERRLVNTQSARVREAFAELGRSRDQKIEQLFARLGIDQVPLVTGQSYIDPLLRLFKEREKRWR